MKLIFKRKVLTRTGIVLLVYVLVDVLPFPVSYKIIHVKELGTRRRARLFATVKISTRSYL